jgi:hypothetical protein
MDAEESVQSGADRNGAAASRVGHAGGGDRWKKRYGSLGVSELRELRQLREENRKLKGLVADLSLDKIILQESLRKNF